MKKRGNKMSRITKLERETAEKIIDTFYPSSVVERWKVDVLEEYKVLVKNIALGIRKVLKDQEKSTGIYAGGGWDPKKMNK
jgi:hypothetical protein